MLPSAAAAAPGWAAALTPQTPAEAQQVAALLAQSQFVPQAFRGKPHDIVVAAAMGARLGLDLFSSLQCIAVVNGKPTIYGDAMLAVCQARPDWRGMSVSWSGEGDDLACTVTVRRQLASGVADTSASFSVREARHAGLWDKPGPWRQFPRRMLEMRARSYALRGAFADALLGFYSREEMEDVRDVDPASVVVHPEAAPTPPAPPAAPPPALAASPAGDPAPPPPAHPAPEPAPEPVAPASEPPSPPSVAEVRAAVQRAAKRIGSVKQTVALLCERLGYPVARADDIRPEDRAKVIAVCESLGGGA